MSSVHRGGDRQRRRPRTTVIPLRSVIRTAVACGGIKSRQKRSDILNIGGFSDAVFQVVSAFFAGDSGRFVSEVEAVEL